MLWQLPQEFHELALTKPHTPTLALLAYLNELHIMSHDSWHLFPYLSCSSFVIVMTWYFMGICWVA